MFIIIDENMKNCKKEFDAFNDMQTLVWTGNYCSVRTDNLLGTLRFMQDNWRRMGWILPDDEYIDEKRVEFNILYFFKETPKN